MKPFNPFQEYDDWKYFLNKTFEWHCYWIILGSTQGQTIAPYVWWIFFVRINQELDLHEIAWCVPRFSYHLIIIMTSLLLVFSILVITSEARVARRAADGGHVKFSDVREGRGMRSGGRVPITYSGACDNSGYSCGRPAVSPHEMENHRDGARVPKVIVDLLPI